MRGDLTRRHVMTQALQDGVWIVPIRAVTVAAVMGRRSGGIKGGSRPATTPTVLVALDALGDGEPDRW